MEKIVSLRPKKVYVDLGYKEKDHHPEDVQVYLSNKSRKKMTRWKKMWMNRKIYNCYFSSKARSQEDRGIQNIRFIDLSEYLR